jgi:hypothetical protein
MHGVCYVQINGFKPETTGSRATMPSNLSSSARVAVLVLLLVPIATAEAFQPKGWQRGPWEKYDSEDGMTIYINDSMPTGVDAVRVDGTIPLPADRVFEVILDEKRAGSYSFVRDFKVLERKENSGYVYQRVGSPGLRDRDFTARVDIIRPTTLNGGPYGYAWKQANWRGPKPKDGVVRAVGIAGLCIVTPKKDGTSAVSYRVWFDPSTWVPDFLINPAVRNAAVEQVRRLRRDTIKRFGS